ncbi:hypothetical protein HGA34_00145 [Candidatus Falkowbacteria bacterium]|nr:hypothetical protein [Candidatus Falkowbacteria bacterium]
MEQLLARIAAFAAAVSKTVEEVTEALKQYLGEFNDSTAEILADEASTPIEDLKPVLTDDGPKIPLPVLKFNLYLLRGKEKVAEQPAAAPVPAAAPAASGFATDVLPAVPDDDSFLEALKVGGVLRVGTTEVICAIRSALANRVGLYDLPKVLLKLIEEKAIKSRKPSGPEYYELQKLVTQRSYAEIFRALEVPGEFATEGRKNQLLDRIDPTLWDALFSFQNQLIGWRDSWSAGMANPMMMFSVMAMGSAGQPLPPGMMTPPDTAPLRDAAESVIETINAVFAGPSIPIVRALAWDAQRVKKLLTDERLPAACGAVDAEQMLLDLDVAVTSDYIRLERSIVRYALGIMEYPKVTPGNEEYNYVGALLQLGLSIPWDKLPERSDKNGKKKAGFEKF